MSETTDTAWPRHNPMGAVYPTETIDRMGAALGIGRGDFVLDAGGGANPLPEASVVVEADLASGHDRDGRVIRTDQRWLAGDLESLPFRDDAFDYAYCSHVLEHVRDPARACEELMRVAARGYIETPRKMAELVAGYPSHRWLVDVVDGVLTFERRWFIEHPLQNLALAHILKHAGARQRALVDFRNLSCVQFVWEGRFEYRVIENDNWQALFDYDNPEHAGWSHFYFALNLLANGAPPAHVRPHAALALRYVHDEAMFHALLGTCAMLAGDRSAAVDALDRAAELGCKDTSVTANRKRLRLQSEGGPCEAALPLGRGTCTPLSDGTCHCTLDTPE